MIIDAIICVALIASGNAIRKSAGLSGSIGGGGAGEPFWRQSERVGPVFSESDNDIRYSFWFGNYGFIRYHAVRIGWKFEPLLANQHILRSLTPGILSGGFHSLQRRRLFMGGMAVIRGCAVEELRPGMRLGGAGDRWLRPYDSETGNRAESQGY